VRHVLQLDQMKRGAHFRAATLRDKERSGALDPVIGVDHAWMSAPTFPPHSHTGFSAVSYVFSDAGTGLKNEDSIGTRNLIRPGGMHWTAAGRGITHEEVPAEAERTAHLFQIFIDLPASRKAAAPYALSLEPENVPIVKLPGVVIRVPLGVFGTARSPLNPPTSLNMLDIQLDAGAALAVPVAPGENAFVMPVKGQMTVNGTKYDADGSEVPTFSSSANGQSISLEARHGSAQAVVFSGIPVQFQSS
jgi:redox-sensitive bicupin YhaK (pirin superfamily)